MKTFDLNKMNVPEVYKLMISAIIPRPIAWISTQNKKGQINLAPFSYFNAVSTKPPCIAVSITYKKDGEKKDTLINIEETGEFVVNSSTENLATQINETSAALDYGIDEMKKAGLTAIPSTLISPPRVKEALIHMECTLLKSLKLGEPKLGGCKLIIGEICAMHVDESILINGNIDPKALKPLSRLGGLYYGKTNEIFELPRPKKT